MKTSSKVLGAAALVLILTLASGPVWAGAVWIEGRVTDAPRVERHRHIQVEGRDYTLMSDIRISRRYESRPGAFDERQLRFRHIRQGDHVMIKAQGSRVYQIIVLD